MWDDLKRQWSSGNMLTRLVFVNVGVFTLLMTLRLLQKLKTIGPEADLGAFGLATTWKGELLIMRPWSVLTHMFVHVDVWHLVMNMLWLYWMGRLYMGQFGARRLLSTYFVGGLAGFGVYVLASNVFPGLQQGTFAYGASAAVMAIMTATATAQPNYVVRLFILGSIPLKYVAIGWVLLDYFALGQGSNPGGNLAHLGGAAFGYAMIRQASVGRDWVGWFERLIDGLVALSKGGRVPRSRRKTKFSKVKDTRSARVKSDEDFNLEKKKRNEQMDLILDKVSKHGYDNLTEEEKAFLFRQSNQ